MSDRLDEILDKLHRQYELDKDFEYLARYIYGLSDQVYIPNDSKDTTGVKVTVDINDLVKSLQSYVDTKIIEAREDTVGQLMAMADMHEADSKYVDERFVTIVERDIDNYLAELRKTL